MVEPGDTTGYRLASLRDGICQELIFDKTVCDRRFDQCLQGFRDFKKLLPGSFSEWAASVIIKRMSSLMAMQVEGENRV